MKVYLLWAYEIETGNSVVIGVYSTYETAQNKVDKLNNESVREYSNLCIVGPLEMDK